MIDIKLLRDKPELFQTSVDRRGLKLNIAEILELDKTRNGLLQLTEALRSQLKVEGKPTAEQLVQLQSVKQEYEQSQAQLDTITQQYSELIQQVPNLIAENTPDGGEDANRVDKTWGENTLSFEPKDHIELNDINDLFDFEAGAKVAGSKFYFTKAKLLRLWQALELYAQDIVAKEGFELMGVPHMVNYDIAAGTGYMPKGEENQNYIDKDQGLVMIATSEIPLTGYHKDEVLNLDTTKLYAGLSPSYRLEAGAYGKYSKGLYRVHQFEKLEMYVFCKPEESNEWLQKIVAIEERICQGLNLPYRVLRIAAGDLSAPAYEKYDIEYFSPADKAYHELTSCSNCTDYQARNLNIRYRNEHGDLDFVHTLNGTAAVSSRLPIAVLENYQQADGTVRVPDALQQYYGNDVL